MKMKKILTIVPAQTTPEKIIIMYEKAVAPIHKIAVI